jgi:leucine dehydrogenase
MVVAEELLTLESESGIFSQIGEMGHESVVFCQDPETGLKAIIGIHSTVLGPSLGGLRFWQYDQEADALRDVLRLSRGMSLKNSAAGLNLGGGKAVIIGDAKKLKTPALLRRFGEFVEGQAGRYITAEDVSITTDDIAIIREKTKFAAGRAVADGGGGDPSPFTACGVYLSMKASAKRAFGSDSLADLSVSIQGAGHVGTYLAEHLAKEGAKIYVTDFYAERAEELAEKVGAVVVDKDAIYDVPADIYAPCALGATLNTQNINRLRVGVVCGAANNQLADENLHGQMLLDRGIVYAPDFVINAGGVINVYQEVLGYDRKLATEKVESLYSTVLNLFATAEAEGITPHQAALQTAMARINSAKAAKLNQ